MRYSDFDIARVYNVINGPSAQILYARCQRERALMDVDFAPLSDK
jgi:hypothetical protein